jgi:tripeptidyl-peptidase II
VPPPADGSSTGPEPAVDPAVAYMLGLMPLRSTGVDVFRSLHPTYDGRGVLIAILDSGIDPGVAGLITTSTGAPKIIELRDFSGEGRIPLTSFPAPTDRELKGAARIGRLTTATTWYRGVFRELPLGRPPAGDVNGNGRNTDEFPVVVVKASDGWVAFIDTNLDGSFEDEMPLHDYRQGRETIALGKQPLTVVANFAETPDSAPVLDLFFDTSGHGTHVAGIAAGSNLFDVAGFNGVAPGAQLIGLKIANNARGGVTVHASMMRAIDYAARYAQARNLPLVLNLSFGVGNEHEGRAVIDSIVDAFLVAHPEMVFAISAGNDGPGWSTLGFPGSADYALSVGASYPGVFTAPPQQGVPPPRDILAWFSSRGGELAKPDVVAPGVAFSSVPRWDMGNEIKGGTSMASPHAAGLAACLVSAMSQEGRRAAAADIMQALRISGRRFNGARVIDDGAGLPLLEAAYQWLEGGHQGSTYRVRASHGVAAAFRRNGFTGTDSVETFTIRHVSGLRAAEFALRATVPWLRVADAVDAGPRTTQIDVTYRPSLLTAPGVYIGTVTALNPRDTVAGPLFTLVNTVIVPTDLTTKVLFDERRTVGPGTVQRYFLRVPAADATLRATVTLPDSLSQQATVRLYEPNGAPARSAPDDIDIGEQQTGSAEILVRAEDMVAGVYELDVVAPPRAAATATVRAELGPVALAEAQGQGIEASSVTSAQGSTVSGQVSHRLVGAERTYAIAGRGLPAESLTVRAPRWAKRMEVDLALPPELWDELTDLSVTVYDSTGQQVRGGNEPVNYAFGRMRLALSDSLTAIPLTVEFYPAFARLPGHAWRGAAKVRFLGLDAPTGEERALALVAGGRTVIKLPNPPSLDLPEGFATLLETRGTTQTGSLAARRSVLPPPARGADGIR